PPRAHPFGNGRPCLLAPPAAPKTKTESEDDSTKHNGQSTTEQAATDPCAYSCPEDTAASEMNPVVVRPANVIVVLLHSNAPCFTGVQPQGARASQSPRYRLINVSCPSNKTERRLSGARFGGSAACRLRP